MGDLSASGAYEHEGTIYHEPLPRIIFANFPDAFTESLRPKHNAKNSSVQFRNPHRAMLQLPAPVAEIDILVIRDKRVPEGAQPASIFPPPGTFEGEAKLPSGQVDRFSTICSQLLARGGICIFLIDEDLGWLSQHANVSVTPNVDHKLWSERSAHSFEGDGPLAGFVRTNLTVPAVYVSLQLPGHNVSVFLRGADKQAYAAMYEPNHPTQRGCVICLPNYGDRADVFDQLLGSVLPSIAPHVFPFRNDSQWLRDAEFQNPDILQLERQKNNIRRKVSEEIAHLDRESQILRMPKHG